MTDQAPAPSPSQPAGQEPPKTEGNLNPSPLQTPAAVLDAFLGLAAGHSVLKGFTIAFVAWPKGLPQQPAIASTAEAAETGMALARCCELIAASMQKAEEPKLVIATPEHTKALQQAAGRPFKKRE